MTRLPVSDMVRIQIQSKSDSEAVGEDTLTVSLVFLRAFSADVRAVQSRRPELGEVLENDASQGL